MYKSEKSMLKSTYRIVVKVCSDEGKLFNSFPEQSTIVWLQVHKLGQFPIDLSSPETLGKYIKLYPNMATASTKILLEILGQSHLCFDIGLAMFEGCLP